MGKTLTFKISADGSSVQVEADGFVGTQCLDKTEQFLRELGQISQQDMKPEAYQHDASLVQGY